MRPTFPFILLVAASLVVPLATIAAPIDVPSRAELVVEGHTVFLTIDALAPTGASASEGEPAGARVNTSPSVERVRADRFPGVLWFNDQYLVAPSQSVVFEESIGGGMTVTSHYGASIAVLVRGDDGHSVREPCGGAVLATNAGERDPREALGTEFALDWTYLDSYRITDPNEHAWIIDKYELAIPTPHTVWAVNILGAPAFSPDTDQEPANDCLADKALFDGLVEDIGTPVGSMDARSVACGMSVDNADPLATGSGDVSLSPFGGFPSWTDDPCMGMMEPSWNGYCYAGIRVDDRDLDGDIDREDCVGPHDVKPRRYNALLYLEWADLLVAGSPRDHSDPFSSLDTNGCQSGTEWPCADEAIWEDKGRDDEEGNSHSFHPSVPVREEAEPCIAQAAGPNPTNHGGSTLPGAGVCDYLHATALLDVYFSASARPLEPAVRIFGVEDAAGASNPFADFLSAYP